MGLTECDAAPCGEEIRLIALLHDGRWIRSEVKTGVRMDDIQPVAIGGRIDRGVAARKTTNTGQRRNEVIGLTVRGRVGHFH